MNRTTTERLAGSVEKGQVAVVWIAIIFSLLVGSKTTHAQEITRTWYLDNVRFDSGAVATGSYDYNIEPYNPFAGQYGAYSNINIDVTSPDGTVREFRIVNPDSDGNEAYLSMVAATGGDLTGKPFLALTLPGGPIPTQPGEPIPPPSPLAMTSAGGVIDILPGPQNLSYLGVCRSSNCGFAEEPYEEALAGGRVIAGPRLWHLDNVRFDSGAVAVGSYVYDRHPYNPFAGQYGTYSNINIDVINPDGSVREFRIVNPDSDGNEAYLSMVAATGGDLTGKPFLALTLPGGPISPPPGEPFPPPSPLAMTNRGGVIDILPGPQNLSYLGVCRSPDCGFAEEPYEEALAGGRVISNPGPQRWYVEGVHFDSGAVASGYYDYDEMPYDPSAGHYGTFSNINIDVTNPDGTVREFRIVNPDSDGNEAYISVVAATGGDLTGKPFLALSLPGAPVNSDPQPTVQSHLAMHNGQGPLSVLPGPQNLSYLGVCRSSDCDFAEAPYEEANAGGRVVREVAPPVILSNNSVNVIENQNDAIDVESTDNLDTEGNGLVYSISGGADQALFNIDVNTGLVTFIDTPDYEAPADAGSDNVYNLQVTVSDLGGRTAVQDIAVTLIDEIEDTTRPTANPTFDPVANTAGWHNDDVTITWNWIDETGGSGIDPLNCGPTSLLAGEGLFTITGQCADLTGNLGLQDSGTVKIDKTAPVANPTFNPPSNAAGWYNADVTITWNWSDPASANGVPLSGLDPDDCELTSMLGGEGSLAIVGQCPDLAGNLGLQGSGIVSIDKSAPDTSITSSPPVESTSTNASFTFDGEDAPGGTPSGVASFMCQLDDGDFSACESPINFGGLSPGEHTFRVFAVDLALNIDPTPANYTWTVLSIDTTAPTASPTFDPAPNPAGWNNTDVTVTFNWTDEAGGSGIEAVACNATTVTSGEGASVGYNGSCSDITGNVGESTGFLLIDKTAPETTITATPADPSSTGDVTFEFGGSDALSGISGFVCTIDNGVIGTPEPCTSPKSYTGLGDGSYIFMVAATDAAGNSDASPASYDWTVESVVATTDLIATQSGSGYVEINGTQGADHMVITGTGPGTIEITDGANDGALVGTFTGVTGLVIKGHHGSNHVEMILVDIPNGLIYTGGNGTDVIEITESLTVGGFLTMDLSSGDNMITTTSDTTLIEVMFNASIEAKGGNDKVEIANIITGNHLTVDLGNGDDEVLLGVTDGTFMVGNRLTINAGGGHNIIRLFSGEFVNAVQAYSGSGMDEYEIRDSMGKYGDILAGGGIDIVTSESNTFSKRFRIDCGPAVDVFDSTNDQGNPFLEWRC